MQPFCAEGLKVKKYCFCALCAICFIFACACSPGKLLVLEGNFRNVSGRYHEAAVSYLRALEYHDAAPYAGYGLGSVYYALDESKAAVERFEDTRRMLESLPAEEHRELRYRNSYNAGIVFFGENDFSAAASAFKDALRVDPSRIEAKRNLELSLQSLVRKNTESVRPQQGQHETETVLFEYLRQKEQKGWESKEWAAVEDVTGPDY
jgi:Ca-activated chloride channel family protein